jgi:hypothetical protein
MKASEALALAIESAGSEIEKVVSLIEKAAKNGELSVSLVNTKPATKEWLRREGYKFEVATTTNNEMITISWRTAEK